MKFESVGKNPERGVESRELTSGERQVLNNAVNEILSGKRAEIDRSPLGDRLSRKVAEAKAKQAELRSEK